MFGKIIIFLASIGWLLSFLLYFFYEKSKSDKLLKFARIGYFGGLISIILASLFLLFNIFSHNFQLTYVWSYSSKKLPFLLQFSTFYAGQEGSFMLWALWLSIIGIFLFNFVRNRNLEGFPLSFYSFVLFVLTIILIFKSPFADLWESFPQGNIPKDFMPEDGRGLNPILENYWIAIHPPMLFLGYSLLTVPFVFAISGWLKKDYSSWIQHATKWALVGAGILGFGIMLGGFWAYETLGWGGFWGWDPVENSSLIPCLFVTALVHTLILQRLNGGLVRTNFVLASLSFIAVLYATYLTRSGVLSDTSVHSFVDPGKVVNVLLLIFQGIFLVFPAIIFFFGLKNLPKIRSSYKLSSREFLTVLGALLLIVSAVIIILGTSLPIFQGWVGLKKVALDPGFYNQWMLPIAILILLLNAISLYFAWKGTDIKAAFKSNIWDLILALVVGIVFTIFNNKNFAFGFLIFSSVFSLIVNIKYIARKIRQKNLRIGPFVSHLGIAILIVGAMLSGGFEQTRTIHLVEGGRANAFDYQFELVTKEQIEKHLSDREKYQYHIKISSNGSNSILKPIVYWSEFNNFEQPFFEPDIKTYISKDIYVAPKSVGFNEFYTPITLQKGKKVKAPWSEDDSIEFISYDMSSMHIGTNTDHFMFGLILKYSIDGKEYDDNVYSILNMKMNSFSPVWRRIPTKDFSIGFTKFEPAENLEQSTIQLSFGQEMFIADVTIKPFIWLVWLGVVFIVVGFFVALTKYRKLPVPSFSPKEVEEEEKVETEETRNE